jgi:hypothetical protein
MTVTVTQRPALVSLPRTTPGVAIDIAEVWPLTSTKANESSRGFAHRAVYCVERSGALEAGLGPNGLVCVM